MMRIRETARGADVAMIEPLLLTSTQISTYAGNQWLTSATGFFFERGKQLYLVTSRHVLVDRPSGHSPSRVEIGFHTDVQNLTRTCGLSIPLYQDGMSVWHQGSDTAGDIDVAVIELERQAIPASALYQCFTPSHLQHPLREVEVGAALLVVGFPLGFQDTLYHLPVVRQATIASSFGLRFQGQGCFLTDARTHRGSSGAPVVMHQSHGDSALPWKLLGVHSSRLDVCTRNPQTDESLGLNCAWYADILMTLTQVRDTARH
jgi:S1-C subfamily serine protease